MCWRRGGEEGKVVPATDWGGRAVAVTRGLRWFTTCQTGPTAVGLLKGIDLDVDLQALEIYSVLRVLIHCIAGNVANDLA